jgi:hypothetical protein
MRNLFTRFSIITLLLSGVCFSQTALTDSQVTTSINHILSGKPHSIGLTLNNLQTNIISGLLCRTCQTSGYTIYVYTPASWIELKAFQARREMLPFGLADVTPEMRLPYIHVLASPSQPEYLNASGMGMASSVHRIVLSSTDRSDVVQPLSESHDKVELNSALRSFTQASAGAVFSVADVERLRSEDPKGEFFLVVVGDNKNKYFKVKTRFFQQLFGSATDGAGTYSTSILDTGQANTRNERTNGNGNAAKVERGSSAFVPHGEAVGSKSNSDTPPESHATKLMQSQSLETTATPANTIETIATGSSAATPSPTTDANGASGDVGSERSPASIGAWSDEKPTVRHDGIRVDHITPGSPADKAGMEVGDYILAMGGVYVFTAQQLMDSVHSYKPGGRVALRFRRRSTIYDTLVVIGSEGEMPVTEVDSAIR